MKADADVGKWFRDRTSNVFMEFLDVLVSEMRPSCHGITRLARRCNLVAHAVSRQPTAALALQERAATFLMV